MFFSLARRGVLAKAALLAAGVSMAAAAQRTGAFDQSRNHPAINYGSAESNTAVDALNRKLAAGTARLVFDPATGYLTSVLELLDVPVESQVMVYTQTSQQAHRISMTNPRAIYFNDEVSVGYIRGAELLEMVAQDPVLGSIFYVIEQQPAAAQRFGREEQCLRCHLSWDTLGVPGLSVLSTFPRKTDRDYANGFFIDHYRAIHERWGGWYVTGTRVPARHMGNLPLFMDKPLDTPPPARVSLQGQFDLTGYLTPYSDVVALMVLDHQAHFANLVTRATWEARLGDPMRVAEAADALADYLLFVDEAPIVDGPITGSSGFAAKFQALGRKDAKGRSLRELDLQARLLKYPVSWLVHSRQFEALPEAPKNLVMGRIKGVIEGALTGPKYAHFTPATRAALRELLDF
jgi:hypothetical protein